MVNFQEQIMLKIAAENLASPAARQIDKDFQSMASNITSAISGISSGMLNMGVVTDNIMQGLTGKSAMDNILGTTSKAETNSVLLKNMLDDTEKHYDSFYKKVDETTDSSLTSMQELIPALKAFKSATGATDKEMTNITDEMANFGAAVLAQTGSTDLAQQSMMDLSKGVKGAFASLDQYGITQDALERTGYWNGDEKDVEGFMKAVQKVTGSTEELMETNTGLDALIGKAFSRAGKKMGNEFLPVIKDIKRGFLELDNELGGNLTASMLAVSGGVEVMNQGFWNVSTAVQGVRDIGDAIKFITGNAKEAEEAIKGASGALETMGNVSSMGADMSGVAGVSGDIANYSNKSDKILDSSANGLMFADLIDDNKKSRKDAKKLLDELEKTGELGNKVQNTSKRVYDPKLWSSYDNFEKMKSVSNFTGKTDGIQNIIDNVSDSSKSLTKVSDELSEVKNISKSVKDAESIAEVTSDIAEVGTAVGAVGPEAAASSVAIEETAVATTTLSGAFTSMIVPLLAISAVIAIMIPIAAGLVIEAMFFLSVIRDVFDALNFDSVDLKGDVEGIKQLSEGIAWIGIAMGAMTFTSIMTGLAVMTSGFLGITGPLTIAKDSLMEASSLLSEFSSVSIDSSVPDNLKKISESLTSVSDAMMALTNTTVATGFSNFVAWVFQFSSTTDAIRQAKDDLIKASTAINELSSGITPISEDKANNIQNVCDSLASVGDAIGALRSVRDGVNWDNLLGGIFNGVDIQTALNTVKNDIQKASTALQSWELPKIPEGIGDKVKAVADTLSSLSESFEALRSLRDNVNWDNFMGGIFNGVDIQTALTNIKTELFYTATNLNGLNSMPPVSEGLGDKIKTVTDTVSIVSQAVTGLSNVPDMGNYNPANISTAVTNIKNVATELSKLNETTFNGDAANSVLNSLSTTMENLKTTLSGASGFGEPSVNIGSQIVNGVKSGLSPLTSEVTTAISSATSRAASSGWTGGSYIGTSVNGGFKSALDLHTTMTTEMGYVKTAVDNGITAAKSAAQNGAEEVVQAFKDGINVGSPGDIARTMDQELKYTKGFIDNAMYPLSQSSFSVAKSIVDSFGNPNLNIDTSNRFKKGNLEGLETIITKAPSNNTSQTIIMYNEVTVDARNKTEKEAQKLLTLALESMDNITNIDVDV